MIFVVELLVLFQRAVSVDLLLAQVRQVLQTIAMLLLLLKAIVIFRLSQVASLLTVELITIWSDCLWVLHTRVHLIAIQLPAGIWLRTVRQIVVVVFGWNDRDATEDALRVNIILLFEQWILTFLTHH